VAAPAYATEAVWDFQSPSNTSPSPNAKVHDYLSTDGNFTITASGFTNFGMAGVGTALFDKSGGGSENGLGFVDDLSGNDEISGTNFIQIDVTGAIAAGVTGFQFAMGSTTQLEQWTVFGADKSGPLANLAVLYGNVQNDQFPTFHALSGYDFYDFYYSGLAPGQCGAGCNANVLLTQFEGLEPTGTVTGGVPELPTWAMGLMGFGLFGFAGLYRKRKPARYAL